MKTEITFHILTLFLSKHKIHICTMWCDYCYCVMWFGAISTVLHHPSHLTVSLIVLFGDVCTKKIHLSSADQPCQYRNSLTCLGTWDSCLISCSVWPPSSQCCRTPSSARPTLSSKPVLSSEVQVAVDPLFFSRFPERCLFWFLFFFFFSLFPLAMNTLRTNFYLQL